MSRFLLGTSIMGATLCLLFAAAFREPTWLGLGVLFAFDALRSLGSR